MLDNNLDFEQNLQSVKTILSQNNLFNKSESQKKINITENDFNLLSKFEKSTLKTIANIFGLMKDGGEVTFSKLKEIMDTLGKSRSDTEKNYLISLFFPEKVKTLHTVNPFPIPTYTYTQKYQLFVVPNKNGCFLAQVICPILLDSSPVTINQNNYISGNVGSIQNPAVWNGNAVGGQNGNPAAGTGSVSNFYVNTHDNLDGTTLGDSTHFTPIMVNQAMPGAFNTYILQCCKLSAKYIGRGDVQSGIFGAAYHLSPLSNKVPDPAPTQFNYVNDSINGVITDISEGVNAVYYPPDYSYLNFLRVNQDNITGGQMSTSLRLNIYGASLPPPNLAGQSAGVILTFVCVWNIIPAPQYAELLPLNYNIEEDSFDFLETSKFIPQSGLITHKNNEIGNIERMLELPSHVRKTALKDYINSGVVNLPSSNRSTILNVLEPVIGTKIPPEVKVDKSLLLKLIEASGSRKKNVDFISNSLKWVD